MGRLWVILGMVLALSVFAGITLQLSSILNLDAPAALSRAVTAVRDAAGSVCTREGTMPGADPGIRMARNAAPVLDRSVVKGIRKTHSETIADPLTQVRVIEEIRQHVSTRYPQT